MMASDRSTWLTVAGVVLLMTAGQLLFKVTAAAWAQQGRLWAVPVLWRLSVALLVYGIATLAWMWVLQRVSLSVAYPVVALTFVLVPLGAWWFFGDHISFRYLLGTALIVAGIAIATTTNTTS